MPFGDGISRTHSFSLTDLHDFDQCVFRFLVRHHLERKFEIDDSSPKMALGTVLDEAIKLYHLSTPTDDPEYLGYIVRGAVRHIKTSIAEKGEKSFHYKHGEFINEELTQHAIQIFKDYFVGVGGKIKKSLGKVGFCEYIIESPKSKYKLWGGPDTFELGDDGIPEVVDYKYHEDPQKGAERLDMDLMPKLYTLLSAEQLKKMGYSKARFIIRQWTDPANQSLYVDFDLDGLGGVVDQIRQRIEIILDNKSVSFCERSFCRACTSEKRPEYLKELEEKKMILLSQDALFAP